MERCISDMRRCGKRTSLFRRSLVGARHRRCRMEEACRVGGQEDRDRVALEDEGADRLGVDGRASPDRQQQNQSTGLRSHYDG